MNIPFPRVSHSTANRPMSLFVMVQHTAMLLFYTVLDDNKTGPLQLSSTPWAPLGAVAAVRSVASALLAAASTHRGVGIEME